MPCEQNTFGRLIAQIRKERGLTQTELAIRCATSQKIISRYELSEDVPSVETAWQIADALQTTLGSLFHPEAPMPALRGTFGERLRAALDQSGLQQSELGLLVQKNTRKLRAYLTGENTPSVEVALRLAEALDVSIDALRPMELQDISAGYAK